MNQGDQLPDMDAVAALMRETAAAEILPFFEKLAAHQVSEKQSGEIVTEVDVKAEQRLTDGLQAILQAPVVGEEGAAADPTIEQRLNHNGPVWIVDPLDGTRNFAKGKKCFAIIIAFCRGGSTLAGWILDPVTGELAWARAGEGAWIEDTRLHVAAPAPIAGMRGSVGRRRREKLDRRAAAGDAVRPAEGLRYGCIGMEYMDLARGRLHFADYALLKPWDHAAGVLLHGEAGGHAALFDDGSAYAPRPSMRERLLLAPDPDTWRALHDNLDFSLRD